MASLIDSVMQPSTTGTKITTSGTSQQTSAITSGDKPFVIVRLLTTADCYVERGTNPTATSSSMRLVANSPEYFKLNNNDKLAVLQVSAAGTFSYTIMV